jgi:hypothetical protein
MDKRTFITVLVILALVSVGYAVYRSTGTTITRVENGTQVVYGEPMHGLMLGLCVFASVCILAIAILYNRDEVTRHEPTATVTKRTTTSTNYPQ